MKPVINEFTGEEIAMKGKNPIADSSTPIPVDVNFDQDLHTIFQEAPPDVLPGKTHEKPGLLETFGGRFAGQEELIQLSRAADHKTEDSSPLDDSVDPNWSPMDDLSVLTGIDKRNTGYILGATGPKDQRRRYNYVLDQQEQDERLSRGNIVMQGLGGFSGAMLSPSSFFPIAKTLKYAKVSQNFLQNLPKVIPGIAIASASHEAVLETAKVGGNLHDWAIDTAVDTLIGSVFAGAHIGISHAADAWKLYNSRNVLKMLNQGIEAKPVIDSKGVINGFKATGVDGSVGAAQVDMAQAYLDSAISKSVIHHIPYIGEMIGKPAGKASSWLTGIISPKIRMMNSDFETIRGFANNYAEHSFDTEGIQQGRPIEAPYQTIVEILKGTNVTMKSQYDGLYLKRNGIEYDPDTFGSRTKANLAGTANYFNNGKITKEQFGREVQYALINDTQSDVAAVNDARNLLREHMDPLYLEYLKLEGISDKIMEPVTSMGYASRVYYAARMELEEPLWMEQVPQKLREDDEIINTLNQPVRNAEAMLRNAIDEHEKMIRVNQYDERVKQSSDNIEALRLAKTAVENRLQDSLREDRNLHRHIEDRFALSATEAKQIDAIQKPLLKIERDLNAQKEVVRKLKETQSRNKQAYIKAKTSETARKRSKLKDEANQDIQAEERKLSELQEKFDSESESLQEKMHNGEIAQELYYRVPNSYRYKLKDPSNRLKLRPVYESDHERQIAAKAYYDSILNQTAEDNIQHIMSKASGTDKENPLVQRTIMFDDKWLYDNNWLHPDPSINVMNYRNFIGKKIASRKMLNRLTINGTFDELVQKLSDEYSAKKNDLKNLYGEDKKKYESAVKRLGKKYKTAKEDLKLSIMQMQGKSNYSAKGRQYSRLANLYAVSTKLGFLALTMSTDNQAIVFKQGFWPYIRDGLFPMMKNLGGMLNTQGGKDIRDNAAHAYVGMRHVNSAYSDKNWTGTTQTYEPVQGKLTKSLETLAHYSNNFSLANYVENFNERWAASVINSKIMRAMKDFSENKITQRDYKDLLRYGLDPKQFSERFLKGSMDKPYHGAGMGRYWEWADKEASNKMSEAIARAVRDTIIRRGPLDAPFAMDNPVFSSIFLFKGYVLASMTRYLAPLLQQAQARQLVGTMLMMAAGSTQNPLRRLVAGQDPVQEEDHMFRNAVRDGGVFSVFGDVYEEANFLTNGLIEETVTNERYRGRTEMGVMNGPAGAMVADMTKIIGAVANREMNKTDLKRIAVNLPFIYSWQGRKLVNTMIENSEYPKTRAQAHKRNIQ